MERGQEKNVDWDTKASSLKSEKKILDTQNFHIW